jgi:hypothetical protein
MIRCKIHAQAALVEIDGCPIVITLIIGFYR